jgi:chemotaxis protein methyltransferase CheR
MNIEDWNFELLKREIFKDTSVDFDQYKNNYLKRRLGVRMRARSITSYDRYRRILESDPSEYNLLLKDITINVTEFFRDPKVFKVIETEILPLIIYNKVTNNRRVIRIWSAGCATGEEPYSVAILLRDLIEDEFDNFLISVYGTDIDDSSLMAAKGGNYLPRQVTNVKPDYLDKYFIIDGENYQVSDQVKEIVKFKKHDLFTENRMSHFDLILCRNVMIYFTKEMQAKLVTRFYRSLNLGGYIVFGKTEGLLGNIKDNFTIVNSEERIYQKIRNRSKT